MSRFARIHVVGAGMAGLAAAVHLAERGHAVTLYEAAPHAGGRCRSYFDTTLGCRIDNGNHLLLQGNRAVMRFLSVVGAADTLIGPNDAAFPFLDLATGERWVLRPGRGRVPWWLFDKARRVPGTRLREYLGVLRLALAPYGRTVAEVLDRQAPLFRRFWRPLTIAMLNTRVSEASAAMLSRVVSETFCQGGGACRPLVPKDGLSESLVEPALSYLRRRGAQIHFAARLRALDLVDGRATGLAFEAGPTPLHEDEAVVLAVPAPVAMRLIPGLDGPEQFRAIVNAHFRIAMAEDTPLFVGIIGGTAEWVFRKREVLSVTISAADRLVDVSSEELSERLWRDVEQAYRLPSQTVPPAQIVKERRATFAATPQEIKRRPPQRTRWGNLALAGDWTDTELPATIEGAVRSGHAAADLMNA